MGIGPGIIEAQFQRPMPVLGLQGQVLGYAEKAGIELASGRVSHVVLRTDWQPIEIRWEELKFDEGRMALKLIPARRR